MKLGHKLMIISISNVNVLIDYEPQIEVANLFFGNLESLMHSIPQKNVLKAC
jgi:hypothetical protein